MNVEQLRDFVSQERERIKERHRFGVAGSEIVEENTQLVDNVIRQIHQVAQQEGMIPLRLRFAVTGLGSYGRRELNPHSDVDVMVLTDTRQASRSIIASFASYLVATLWDVGFEVGHSTRTIRDCVRLLQGDIVSRTSLLEARFVVGIEDVFESFEQRMEKTLFKRGIADFVDAKVREWRERHEAYGSSIYIQEPDVKEAVGGLRDVHAAFWIARARYGIRNIRELPELTILTEEMTSLTKEALDFFWRVRNELHFLKGRRQDQLSFELQQDVAHHLGYQDSDHVLAEERLMQDYFRHAYCLSEVGHMVIQRAQQPPTWKRWLQERRRIKLDECIHVQGGTLRLQPEHAKPHSYINLFLHKAQNRLPLHADARDAVRSFAMGLGDGQRNTPEMGNSFLEVLRERDGVGHALRSMHAMGLLKAYIPEFAPLQHLVRRDYYHRYTLDEHTFLAIQNLDASTLTDLPYGQPIRETIELIDKPELVRLALLLHDIGIPEGGPKGHDERSAVLARDILGRLPSVSAKDADFVLFLVQHHLLMSRIAQQRDLDDPAVIQRFVETLADEEYLRMLYVLTFADMRAVNLDIWNEWNATLLNELYRRSLHWMAGGYAETLRQRNELMAETQKLLLPRNIPESRLERHFDTMPERAWQGMSAEEIALHIRIIEELQEYPFILRLNQQRDGYSSVIICTRDSQGLFHRITGALAESGINILSAQLFTREDGVVLNQLSVSGPNNTCLLPDDIPQLETKMAEALVGHLDLSKLETMQGPGDMQRRGIESEVSLNNEESDEYTIIDVHTQDRLGLLYTLTGVFQELGLDIGLAKISTEAHSVADAFYVLDERHRKITDPEQQKCVREALLAVLP